MEKEKPTQAAVVPLHGGQLSPEEMEDRNRKANQRIQALLSGKATPQNEMTGYCVAQLRQLYAEQDGARNNQELLETQLEQVKKRRTQLSGEIAASVRTLAYADPVLRAFDPTNSAGDTMAVSETKEQPSDGVKAKTQ